MSIYTKLSQLKWDFYSILSTPFCLAPIKKNKIVLQNFAGRGYGDNPKYIAEAIIRNNMDYELVWLCNDLKEDMPPEIRKVKFESPQAYYEMATAGIWISNVWTGVYSKKRRNQFFLQTWHGSIAFKKIEKAAEGNLSSEYVRTAKRMGKYCNLLISNATWLTEMYKKDLWYEGDILEKGLPRMEVLYNTPEKVIRQIYSRFGIERNKKIILYAPTFRKNDSIENYKFDYVKCCKAMSDKFGKEYVMLVRLHPNAARLIEKLNFPKGVYDATSYPDMQELLAVSDVLITDYSSSMFDMGMIKKKVFLLAKDYDSYVNKDRGGVQFELNELPFLLSQSEDELWEKIQNFSEEYYSSSVKKFMDSLGIIHNENSVMDIIAEIEKRRI